MSSMLKQIPFLGKVFLVSLGISLGIKYLAPFLGIPPTTLAALTPVVGVPLVIALMLGFQR